MKISLSQVSKRFQRHWIFKDVNIVFNTPGKYALLGANGSGKSTLMRVISGMQAPSKGKLDYDLDGRALESTKVFPYISYCAPGMELVEELTLNEFLEFHFSFKPILKGLTIRDIIQITGLGGASTKLIGDYSSGMKQRVKLAQAIFTNTPVLLLDEPCTNLDQPGVEQYQSWIKDHTAQRLVIVASNDPREYFFL